MQWALRRQFLFALSGLVLLSIILAGAYWYFLYEPPSCADGVQNQNEEGVDCGGECARVCVAPTISGLWARSVPVSPGVYHAVALARNPDTTAAGIVPYSFSLFDDRNILIATREGTIYLAPGEVAPIFEANVVAGERVVERTFIEFGPGTFERVERSPSPLRVLSFASDAPAGRVTALIENQGSTPVEGATVTALIFGSADVLIRASQTELPLIGPRERREVVFTWQESFNEPARIDIIPRTDSL